MFDMSSLAITIRHDNSLAHEGVYSSGLEVGRQCSDPGGRYSEPAPFSAFKNPDFGLRLVVVPEATTEVPRRLFNIKIEDNQIKLTNIHRSHPLNLASTETHLAPGRSALFGRTVTVELLDNLLIFIALSEEESEEDSQCYQSLNSKPLNPAEFDAQDVSQTLMQLVATVDPAAINRSNRETADFGEFATGEKSRSAFDSSKDESKATADARYPLLEILRKTLGVVREASGSDAFLKAAVETACQIVGLDHTVLLVLDSKGRWRAKAKYRKARGTTKKEISQTILKRVVKTGRTQVFDGMTWQPQGSSLADMKFALGAPVLSREGEVVAVLYGDRRGGIGTGRIMEIEAIFVEILAGAVAAGLARKEEEERRVALAGYFSPRVADILSQQPELLKPKQAEVSVLFCDIRGFSRITENAEPEFTFEWLQDVLSEVSQCVIDLDGVLVDYVGDQLFANWGAPDAQPDHHDRALTAATHILRKMVDLQRRWNDRLEKPFSLGVGVSTGIAQAGNVGSRQKFKYGVLGNTVNLGSRLQDATKRLGVDCVADGSCVLKANWLDRTRRLSKLRVPGIESVVDAYEIPATVRDDWMVLREKYQLALEDFENRRFAEATSLLGGLLQEFPDDKPSQLLLERAVRELAGPSDDFDAVYNLTKKL